jgi:hypothetical protein
MLSLYIIDFSVVRRLSEANRFKKWWRKYIVDEEIDEEI